MDIYIYIYIHIHTYTHIYIQDWLAILASRYNENMMRRRENALDVTFSKHASMVFIPRLVFFFSFFFPVFFGRERAQRLRKPCFQICLCVWSFPNLSHMWVFSSRLVFSFFFLFGEHARRRAHARTRARTHTHAHARTHAHTRTHARTHAHTHTGIRHAARAAVRPGAGLAR